MLFCWCIGISGVCTIVPVFNSLSTHVDVRGEDSKQSSSDGMSVMGMSNVGRVESEEAAGIIADEKERITGEGV